MGQTKLMYEDFLLPGNVRFKVDTFYTIPKEVVKINPSRVIIISDRGIKNTGLVDKTADLVRKTNIPYEIFTDISGEPTFTLLESVIENYTGAENQLIIGIGGGSAMDVAKTVAALLNKNDLTDYLFGNKQIENRAAYCILLPTTSGTGAEVTMNAIFEDESQALKRGLVSPSLLPDVAIIDPKLTISCPSRVTAASGVDAFTHAIESYVAVRATPLTKMYAEKAMRFFPKHIHRAVHHGQDLDARIGMSRVSNLAGVSLANAGVGAVHALAYPLGGKFHIEHGVANALLMPYVFEVTGKTCTEQMVRVADFLRLGDYRKKTYKALGAIINYLHGLQQDLELPTSLKELKVDRDSLPLLAEQASQVTRLLSNTPYHLSKEKILTIYEQAYDGYLKLI